MRRRKSTEGLTPTAQESLSVSSPREMRGRRHRRHRPAPPGAFAVAFVPDEIKTLAGRKVYQLFRRGTVPSGTANVESGSSVRHEILRGLILRGRRFLTV